MEMNGLLLTEMDAVPHFMSMHMSNLYMSRNEMSVHPSVGVPKLMGIMASTFLRMV